MFRISLVAKLKGIILIVSIANIRGYTQGKLDVINRFFTEKVTLAHLLFIFVLLFIIHVLMINFIEFQTFVIFQLIPDTTG